MFQFGLFSTFIPYLIFAISYIGFLGYNALQKENTVDFTNSTQQIQLKQSEYFQLSQIDYFNKQQITKKTTLNFLTCFNVFYCYPVIFYLDDYKQDYHFQSIFSRPPPAKLS
ncbi:MAG: hypothetical protein ACLFVR_14415 [Thiohalospira sp.]